MIDGISSSSVVPALAVQALPPSLGESIQTGLLVGATVVLLAVLLVVIWLTVDVEYWVPIQIPVVSGRSKESHGSTASHVDEQERVLQVLERENGQLMQSRIVEKTEYSKVKTSRILSTLAEDGDVIKVPVGRQNLICLPDNVPEILSEAQTDRPKVTRDSGNRPTATPNDSDRSAQSTHNDGRL